METIMTNTTVKAFRMIKASPDQLRAIANQLDIALKDSKNFSAVVQISTDVAVICEKELNSYEVSRE